MKPQKSTTLFLLCLMASLSGCSSNIGNDKCLGFIPVYINGTDAISGQTARQILRNNEYGKQQCSWKRVK